MLVAIGPGGSDSVETTANTNGDTTMVLPEHWLRLDRMPSPTGDGGETKVDREAVLEVIAKSKLEAAKLKAEAIRDRELKLTTFNGYQGAQVVVGAYGNARGVMADTVEGLRQDLDTFADDLKACLSTLDDADALSAATLARMAEVAPSDHGAANHQSASSQTGFQVNDEEQP